MIHGCTCWYVCRSHSLYSRVQRLAAAVRSTHAHAAAAGYRIPLPPHIVLLSHTMSRETLPGFKPFLCDSEYMECEVCQVAIKPGETLQAVPATRVPLEAWAVVRCFPSCEQAVEIRKGPLPAVDLSPKTKTFYSKYLNTCCKCYGVIPRGDLMTATIVDLPRVPYQTRFFNKHHFPACPPPSPPR